LKQDLDGGLDSLKKLYDDKTLPVDVWCQAALSYGRVAQLAQERKELYQDLGADANPSDVFMEVISKAPTSKAACTAMLFDLSDDFEGDDPKKIDEALARLEKFCKDFKGKPEYLVSLHLLADQKYIYSKNDFSSAVSHLETAYASGVANPRDAEIVLYRIGRIYDLKLKDKKNAQKFYKTFLKKHPESGYAPAVKRFLGEINGNKKGGGENGKK
jgi:tetratricopeptide (TPR) repeat protein